MQNLSEKSIHYYEKNEIYEVFCQAEDYLDKVYHSLLPVITGKVVLDVGCGTGKYVEKFYRSSKRYIALDQSEKQISKAKEKALNNNVEFLCADASHIPLPDDSIDVVLATWVLGTVLDIHKRNLILEEINRVLKKDGTIYLVENDIGGEFERIRNRYPNIKKTEDYNEWCIKHGFCKFQSFQTFFSFGDLETAKNIFSDIWGDIVGKNVRSSRIEHNIVIFQRNKKNIAEIKTFIPGNIFQIHIKEGDYIKKGQKVVTMEAMKTEIPVISLISGTVSSIHVEIGQKIMQNQLLVRVEVENNDI